MLRDEFFFFLKVLNLLCKRIGKSGKGRLETDVNLVSAAISRVQSSVVGV